MKTLLCFFFALASLLCFLKGEKNIRWMIFSWILFGLSITSKSASVTVPVIFLIAHIKMYRFKKIWMLIPFFILSGWNTYRVLRSPVTIEGKDKAEVITQVKESPSTSAEVVVAPVPKIETEKDTPAIEKPLVTQEKKSKPKSEKKKKQPLPVKKKTEPLKEIQPVISIEKVVEKPVDVAPPVILEARSPAKPKFKLPDVGLILQTLHYYFWQSFLPIINVPVRGLNYQHAGVEHYVHILFLIIICIILWKDSALIYLAAGHFLLLPFIGIIKAPFMNVTWVSDQHLYLILPCFLAFWMRLIDKINWKFAWIIPALFTLWFGWKTLSTTPTYKNQFVFYHKSLEYNPMNVPIAYNLAFAKLLHADINGALLIVETTITLAQTNPIMMKSYFYPYILDLKLKIDH